MDIEKTMQFLLEQQARFDARQAEFVERQAQFEKRMARYRIFCRISPHLK